MTTRTITVIKGDGIGDEIMRSTLDVLNQLGCNLTYDFHEAGSGANAQWGDILPAETLQSAERNRIALIGPMNKAKNVENGSVTDRLRKHFNLFANVRPTVSFKGIQTRYEGIDILTVRESIQGLYSGAGQQISRDGNHAETLSTVTRESVETIATFAYELARREKRNRVTVVHKANVLTATSGLFLKVAKEIGERYPDIESCDTMVDSACMQLVMNPHQFDVILTTNLFGDIISDICAGLVGGLSVAPSANVGNDCALFGVCHGAAPEIAGKDLANPTCMMLAGAQMLEYLNMKDKADIMRLAIQSVIADKLDATRDLGGEAGTKCFTQAVIERLK